MDINLKDCINKLRLILRDTKKDKNILDNFLCEVSNMLNADILLVDMEGNVLYEKNKGLVSFTLRNEIISDKILEEQVVKQLENIESIKINITLDNLYTTKFNRQILKNIYGVFIPIFVYNQKLANMIIYRKDNIFKDLDILCEYLESVVSLIMWGYKSAYLNENQNKRQDIKVCIDTLSYSELEAVINIFDEIKDIEGIIIASKIADKAGITRSVIVNALRKFESARLIETRSLGMKGTYIKILNEYLLEEINKFKN